jgi:hypothetical protein
MKLSDFGFIYVEIPAIFVGDSQPVFGCFLDQFGGFLRADDFSGEAFFHPPEQLAHMVSMRVRQKQMPDIAKPTGSWQILWIRGLDFAVLALSRPAVDGAERSGFPYLEEMA